MMNPLETSASRPVVLLGASNLTLGWNPLLQALTSRLREPLDIFAALGMGRSYVDWSSFGIRRLPGIMGSGIWDALLQHHPQPQSPPLIMITDIGNDLVYRRTPDQILNAVGCCIDQLQAWSPDCRILITGLPVDSVTHLSRMRFLIARSLLFPGSRLQLADVQRDAQLLNEAIVHEAHARQLTYVPPLPQWYGLDPIHIQRRHRLAAFHHYLNSLLQPELAQANVIQNNDPPFATLSTRLSIPSLPAAQQQHRWGKLCSTPQPCFTSSALRVFGF